MPPTKNEETTKEPKQVNIEVPTLSYMHARRPRYSIGEGGTKAGSTCSQPVATSTGKHGNEPIWLALPMQLPSPCRTGRLTVGQV